MGLWYPKDSVFELIAYSDADLAGCHDDCKSTSGGIQFLGEKYNKILMYYNSKSEIAISCNPVQHSRTKHINIRYHFIKEGVEKGKVELCFDKTEYQLADLFTKALPKEMFEYLVHRIVDAPIIYMRKFWYTIRQVEEEKETIRFMIDQQEVHFTLDMFHKVPNFPEATAANPFMRPADFTTIKKFLKIIRYEAECISATRFFIKHLTQLWQMLFKFLNCCTTTRITGLDQAKLNILQMFHAVVNRRNVDYVALIWFDLL
ncbi:hypothetical protein Tco_1036067 [Tanacetum coccineum]